MPCTFYSPTHVSPAASANASAFLPCGLSHRRRILLRLSHASDGTTSALPNVISHKHQPANKPAGSLPLTACPIPTRARVPLQHSEVLLHVPGDGLPGSPGPFYISSLESIHNCIPL